MRYPIISAADASTYLVAKRAGESVDLERLTRTRGEGQDLAQDFVNNLRAELAVLKTKYPRAYVKGSKDSIQFEAKAAQSVHEHVAAPPEVLADPDFWLWLAVTHFSDLIEWRYGNPPSGANLANYGIGARSENLMYRLWLRADLVLDEQAADRYHLCKRGQIDFYRSHLFRQSYANARNFARALLWFQYPHSDTSAPNLGVEQIRELVKRLRRLRANLFVEILDEQECRHVIEAEAGIVLGAA